MKNSLMRNQMLAVGTKIAYKPAKPEFFHMTGDELVGTVIAFNGNIINVPWFTLQTRGGQHFLNYAPERIRELSDKEFSESYGPQQVPKKAKKGLVIVQPNIVSMLGIKPAITKFNGSKTDFVIDLIQKNPSLKGNALISLVVSELGGTNSAANSLIYIARKRMDPK